MFKSSSTATFSNKTKLNFPEHYYSKEKRQSIHNAMTKQALASAVLELTRAIKYSMI
jgi:hypothetical protein